MSSRVWWAGHAWVGGRPEVCGRVGNRQMGGLGRVGGSGAS